jgi:hypothetical protein
MTSHFFGLLLIAENRYCHGEPRRTMTVENSSTAQIATR